jgi:uncharacterized tellurite resistance protein B-like protein
MTKSILEFEKALQKEAERYLNQCFSMDGKTINHHIKQIETEPDETPSLVKTLLRALKAERRKARIKHWSYSLSRHIALRQALEQALEQ